MLFEVKSRSPESWGPLASLDEDQFSKIINNRIGQTKQLIKSANKLKPFKISFTREYKSQQFEIMATDKYQALEMAKDYFAKNRESIYFKESWEKRGYNSATVYSR
jgi:hypothetical protein